MTETARYKITNRPIILSVNKAFGKASSKVAAPVAARQSQMTLAAAIPKAASIAGRNPYLNAEAMTRPTAGPGVNPPRPNSTTSDIQRSSDMLGALIAPPLGVNHQQSFG